MKINPILAVIACILGLGGVFVAFSSSVLTSDLVINISIALLSSILALAGILLFEKDYKISIVQYVICAFGVLLGLLVYGIPSFVLFIIAAAITFFEKEKSQNYTEKNILDAHFFGDESEIRERYNNFPKNTTNSTIYWIIPLITIILLLLVGVVGGLIYDNDLESKMDAIEISNLSSDIKRSYQNYTGGVHGVLSSDRDFDNIQIKGKWYSANGTLIEENYDLNITSIKQSQKYPINLPYDKPTSEKPAKIEIEVTESDENMVLYSRNVTFN
ncbi:MAG: hypothetical protein E7Z85_04090 [Methanosphaera stadtmanae]|nr:hypothetical protein [Methanosphaera stadtmanae]